MMMKKRKTFFFFGCERERDKAGILYVKNSFSPPPPAANYHESKRVGIS